MKNSSLMAVIVVIVALVSVAGFAYFNQTQPIAPLQTAAPTEAAAPGSAGAPSTVTETTDTASTTSRYVEFTPEILGSSKDTRRVLFFYANWCPTCIPADKSFRADLSRIPTDVTVIRVNYNDNQTDQAEKDLAKQYGVTYQHTYVQLDEQDNAVTKWNGGDIDELLTKIK